MWWEWDTSSRAQIDSGGGTQAVVLKLTWWGWRTSGQAQNDMVETGDKQLHLN